MLVRKVFPGRLEGEPVLRLETGQHRRGGVELLAAAQPVVAAHVELEDAAAIAAGSRRLFRAGMGHRAQHQRHAEGSRTARRGRGTAGLERLDRADGRQQHILCAAGNVEGGQVTGDPFLRMDGQAVFKLAVNSLTRSAHEVCEEAGIDVSELDWMVPHQANIRILNFIARKLDLPEEKLIVTLDRHANTSAASVPLALDVAWRDGRIRAGQTVLLQGVGGGFTWGSVLVKI